MADKVQKNQLLIVEDDKMMLKLLEKIFSNVYEVRLAPSGEDALKVMKLGFNPGVILSDQIMGGISGAEFLHKTQTFMPDAIRILLTASTDPKENLMLLQQAGALMCITKPFDTLYIVQNIRVAFEIYNNKRNSKLLASSYEKIRVSFEAAEKRNKELADMTDYETSELVKGLSRLIRKEENYYFRDHTNDVSQIVKVMADEMGLTPQQRNNLVLSAMLHNIYLMGLEPRCKLINPSEIIEKPELNKLKEHFKYCYSTIVGIHIIKSYSITAMKIYERADGTGFPNNLSGADFNTEAQILSLANLYHNYVYRMQLSQVKQLQTDGKVMLSKLDINERNKDVISFLYKRLKWYSTDILDKFRDIVRRKLVNCFASADKDLWIFQNSDDHLIPKFKKSSQELHQEKVFESTKTFVEIEDENGQVVEMIAQSITYNDLKVGMKLYKDITTNEGMAIYKAGTIINDTQLAKVEELIEEEQLKGYAVIIYPKS